jgi:hypothetical protein
MVERPEMLSPGREQGVAHIDRDGSGFPSLLRGRDDVSPVFLAWIQKEQVDFLFSRLSQCPEEKEILGRKTRKPEKEEAGRKICGDSPGTIPEETFHQPGAMFGSIPFSGEFPPEDGRPVILSLATFPLEKKVRPIDHRPVVKIGKNKGKIIETTFLRRVAREGADREEGRGQSQPG